MTTIRCDVLVIGSTLGALVAGSFLAGKRLRTILVEEELHAKRPPMLREPFLLSGLESGGPIDRVLRDVSISMLERRDLRHEPLAFQLVLPGGARIDVGGGREALAAELAAYGVADADAARAWLEQSDAAADAVRQRLLEQEPSALEEARGLLGARRRSPQEQLPEPPPPPSQLDEFVGCQLHALSGVEAAASPAARALLVRGSRDGVFAQPHAAFGFLDLFRRRFLASHGEVRGAERFGFAIDRAEVGIELPRERIFARALVIGVPRAPLARVVGEVGSCPRWLAGPAPRPVARRMLRAESDALPVGMGTRVICADTPPGSPPWSLCRAVDPDDARIEWLVVSGSCSDPEAPLGSIAPFSEGRIVPVDVGPAPTWDLDSTDLRFPEPRAPSGLRRRPIVVAVGPEIAPDLGFEGEVLGARQTALRLAQALGH